MGLFRRRKKDMPDVVCSAVIVAAGSSTRMGLDKLMAEIGGIPAVVRTLTAFQQAPCINEIVVVTRSELVAELAGLCKEFDLTKVTKRSEEPHV